MRTCRVLKTAIVMTAFAVPPVAQVKPHQNSPLASGPVTPCTSMAEMRDAEEKRECEKRDTPRLFLVAGKRDAALRLLCATNEARVAFGDDENGEPTRCLQPVGVKAGGSK
jgi:hypothetical protein